MSGKRLAERREFNDDPLAISVRIKLTVFHDAGSPSVVSENARSQAVLAALGHIVEARLADESGTEFSGLHWSHVFNMTFGGGSIIAYISVHLNEAIEIVKYVGEVSAGVDLIGKSAKWLLPTSQQVVVKAVSEWLPAG